jgi:hypothetical protein
VHSTAPPWASGKAMPSGFMPLGDRLARSHQQPGLNLPSTAETGTTGLSGSCWQPAMTRTGKGPVTGLTHLRASHRPACVSLHTLCDGICLKTLTCLLQDLLNSCTQNHNRRGWVWKEDMAAVGCWLYFTLLAAAIQLCTQTLTDAGLQEGPR